MVQITGVYELIDSKHYASHLVTMGLPQEMAKEVEEWKPKIEFLHSGDKITVTLHFEIPISMELTLNQEIEEAFGDFRVKTVASMEGGRLIQKSKYPSGKNETKIHYFTDSGLTLIYQSEDPGSPDAVRMFRRL